MLRTYFQQNRDWFTNFDHPFNTLDGMESEIAELRTISKVSRLRKQIECREEGAWMVVKDVPDETAPSGSRKVTAYGRTRRSVVRSVTSHSDFAKPFSNNNSTDEPLIQHPIEDDESEEAKPNSVEITEVFDEPLRGNVVELDKVISSEKPQKKTSVITLGEGNIVLLDPEEESNFHVTGVNKGKVADVVSTLEKNTEKKPKKVGFSKTEVHFAPDSGKINIVETDEKPPPTQIFRRKKRQRSTRKGSNCLPKHYFGDLTSDIDDNTVFSDQGKDDPVALPAPLPEIKPIPQLKEIFPTFERTIKSENKDAKYRHSSPVKLDVDLENNQFDDKEFFRKVKQPAFRERFLKDNESLSIQSVLNLGTYGEKIHHIDVEGESSTNPRDEVKQPVVNGKENNTSLNDLISRHQAFSKDKFSPLSNLKEKSNSSLENGSPILRYTELFKAPVKTKSSEDSPLSSRVEKDLNNSTMHYPRSKSEYADYGFLKKSKSIIEEEKDLYSSSPRVPIDQDIKPDPAFLGSSKLQSLIQNSVEHEFQLRLKQILQKKNINGEDTNATTEKMKSPVKILHPLPQETTSSPVKYGVSGAKQKEVGDSTSKRGATSKKEEVLNKIYMESLSTVKKGGEFKKMPYLLNEEPVPAPRDKMRLKSQLDPPKPKPRTIISPERPRTGRASTPRHPTRLSFKADTSSLSRKSRSKEHLVKIREPDRAPSRTSQRGDDHQLKKSPAKTDSGTQRISKTTTVQVKKVSRGEPLRSFEKVSNGWIGVVASPKANQKDAPKTTATFKTSPTKTVASTSSTHHSGLRKTGTPSGTLRSGKGTVKSSRQFSLSREHLSSAKLVKEVSPSRPTARVKPEPRAPAPRGTKEASYGRLRRNSNDSVRQADDEVKAYMFRSPPKGVNSYPALRESFYKCSVL